MKDEVAKITYATPTITEVTIECSGSLCQSYDSYMRVSWTEVDAADRDVYDGYYDEY